MSLILTVLVASAGLCWLGWMILAETKRYQQRIFVRETLAASPLDDIWISGCLDRTTYRMAGSRTTTK